MPGSRPASGVVLVAFQTSSGDDHLPVLVPRVPVTGSGPSGTVAARAAYAAAIATSSVESSR